MNYEINTPPEGALPQQGESAYKRSSFCNSGTCVEVAIEAGEYLLRDAKNPNGPVIPASQPAFRGLMLAIKANEIGECE